MARGLLLAVLTAGLLFVLGGTGLAAYKFNEPLVRATGPEELVFDHSTQACQPDDIPDTPARAFRDSQNRIQLLASHYHTRRAIGTTLANVTHECPLVFGSHSDPNPANYNALEWIHSAYTVDGQKVYGFVHEEFHGWEVYEECAALVGTPDISKCWYNAVTLATSTNAGDSYDHATPPGQLLASVPYQFAALQGPSGVHRPSNLVAKDGHYYMMAVFQKTGVQKAGICLMRTQNLDDPTSWRAWDGSGFGVRFINPYVETGANPANHVCEPVSSATTGPLRGFESYGLVYSTYLGKYMLWGATMKDPTRKIAGFYFSLSDDLINWPEPTLLMEAEIPVVSHQCGDPDPVRDASLVDPASPTRNFETIGRSPYLYMTRFNYFYDGSGGCSLTLDRDLIRIPIEFTVPNQDPTASFTASPNPTVTGQAVTLNGSASSDRDGSIANYKWDLDGDGSFETDTGTNAVASQTYATAGTPTVRLRVTDNRGASNETSRVLTVATQPPTASFTVSPNPALAGEVVAFNGSASSDPDGSIASFKWDLDGDGSLETDTGTTPTATKAYSAAASVTVTMRVTDDNGAFAETTRILAVDAPQNQVPTASLTATPNPALVNDLVSFDGSASSDPDDSIANYRWDLDGNGSFETDTGTTATTSHTYTSAGTFTVTLRVTDNAGGAGETSRAVIVNAPPSASFTAAPNPAVTGQLVSFDGSTSSDPDGTIAKYEWDLDGNGSFETDTAGVATATSSYAAAVTFAVALRVTDDKGASSDTTGTLTVSAPAPPPPVPITDPPQPVFPPTGTSGQPSPKLPSCSSIRKKRDRYVKQRRSARSKLAKAHKAPAKRRYKSRIRSLTRQIKKISKTPCST